MRRQPSIQRTDLRLRVGRQGAVLTLLAGVESMHQVTLRGGDRLGVIGDKEQIEAAEHLAVGA